MLATLMDANWPSENAAPLRTVFCTSGGLSGALVLERLRACPDLALCGIVRSSRVLDPRFGFARGALEQIRRSGLAYAAYLFCATTLADVLWPIGRRVRPAARGTVNASPRKLAGIGEPPVHAEHAGAGPRNEVPVLRTRDLNDAAGLDFLRVCAPDLLVSAFFNQRLRAPVLSVPKLACVNIHPSLLPELKGVDPAFQALLRSMPLGVTVHFMTPELDAGRILTRRSVTMPPRVSVLHATARLFDAGAQDLVAALGRIHAGETGIPQEGDGSYQSWPTRAEVRELRANKAALMRPGDMALIAGISTAGPARTP